MESFLFHLYVTAVGFVTAGLSASFFQLVTGRPLGFEMRSVRGLAALLGVLARVVAGPAIIARNSVRGARLENRAPHWLFLSFSLVALWSFFSGVVTLELIFRIAG